ncbi:MAG TPA: hypothetical protein VG734_08030 [Lacunisphaera sp.]|nr:hypothetical protein [Lacunisphaera sp.]
MNKSIYFPGDDTVEFAKALNDLATALKPPAPGIAYKVTGAVIVSMKGGVEVADGTAGAVKLLRVDLQK